MAILLCGQPDVIWEDAGRPHRHTGRDDHLGGEARAAGDGDPAVDGGLGVVDGVVGGGDRGEQGALSEGGGGAGLVGPRVGGEPGGRAEVMAGGGQVVHIAPLGTAGVH